MIFTVGLGQINPVLGDLEKNFSLHADMIEKAKEARVDLLIFPELSLTGYYLRDLVPDVALTLNAPFIKKFQEMSHDISLAIGLVEESREHLFYNASIYFEDGEIKHLYRKVYLPTYGMFDEQRYFARGDRIRAFDTKFGRFGILICEDAWHPSAACILSQDGADMIMIPSNSPGRGLSEGEKLSISETWESINTVYAKFLTVYVCYAGRIGYEDGVNFWGGSEIITPGGERIAKGSYFDSSLVIGTVDTRAIRRERIVTPTLRDEDLPLTLREFERIYKERFFKRR
ncbi:MAG: carbon-nitrogen hydrolase [Candidatus Tectomicrobia bacterium]|nr:carbon-nitrogen hydrolase [Candidatus Tectomicrobia bacterium]